MSICGNPDQKYEHCRRYNGVIWNGFWDCFSGFGEVEFVLKGLDYYCIFFGNYFYMLIYLYIKNFKVYSTLYFMSRFQIVK